MKTAKRAIGQLKRIPRIWQMYDAAPRRLFANNVAGKRRRRCNGSGIMMIDQQLLSKIYEMCLLLPMHYKYIGFIL